MRQYARTSKAYRLKNGETCALMTRAFDDSRNSGRRFEVQAVTKQRYPPVYENPGTRGGQKGMPRCGANKAPGEANLKVRLYVL